LAKKYSADIIWQLIQLAEFFWAEEISVAKLNIQQWLAGLMGTVIAGDEFYAYNKSLLLIQQWY
jgi:hypothetical protein